MRNLHKPILIILLLIGCSVVQAFSQANVRVEGVGIAIWNVSDRGTGEQPMHPIGIPPKFEDNAENRPGRQHWWIGTRPAALRDLDYATVATDANDTRDNSMDRIVADAPTTLLIAVPINNLNAEGWTRTSTSFNSTIADFYVYEYDYTTPNEYIDIPYNDEDLPTIVFAEKGRLRFDNPPPISELSEGVTIDFAYSDYNRGDFTVDPNIIILPNGDYIAGEKQRRHISTDKGKTWTRLASNYDVEHASTFEHRGDLYIIGDERGGSRGAIVRSTDGGRTWSDPVKLLADFRNSPSHVEKSRGRIWIGFENAPRPHYVNVLSASEDSDLMDPDSWVATNNRIERNGNEPDMVLDRDGWPIVVTKGGLKVKASSPTEASVVGEFSLPGSGSKYSMKYDPVSDKWWALTSYSPIEGNVRTGITLFSSDDLENWSQERVVIQGTSTQFHGFNYPFFQFDGDDIVFVSRTAWPTELGQAQRWHDATMLSFHRVQNFRGDTPTNPVCSLVPYLNINDEGWNRVGTASVSAGDKVWFGPQSSRFGADQTEGWSYSGPNGFTHSGRSLVIENIQADQAGTYTVTNTDPNGCEASYAFTLTVNGPGGGGLSEGRYYLRNVASGRYLDANPGGEVVQGSSSGGEDTQWNLVESSAGYYFIDNGMGDRGPLTAKPSLDNAITYLAESYNETPYQNREWEAVSVGGNVYQFRCKDSARGYVTGSGTREVINASDGSSEAAQWEVIAVGSSSRTESEVALGKGGEPVVYPNPVSSQTFTVSLANVQASEVSVYNVMGVRVYHQRIDLEKVPSSLTIATPSKAGLYYITTVSPGEGSQTVKFIVE